MLGVWVMKQIFRMASGFSIVNIADIIRCKASVNYTSILTVQTSLIIVAKTLKEFESLLDGYHFFRVHKSHLVNIAHVKNYKKEEESC